MEFVIDANILISALIKESHTRNFILLSGHSFYVPEFVFSEIAEHMNELKEKMFLSENEIKEILNQTIVLGNVKIIPLEELKEFREESLQLSPDPDDAHYVALALKIKCVIWSNDKKLKENLKKVKVYSSKEVMRGL